MLLRKSSRAGVVGADKRLFARVSSDVNLEERRAFESLMTFVARLRNLRLRLRPAFLPLFRQLFLVSIAVLAARDGSSHFRQFRADRVCKPLRFLLKLDVLTAGAFHEVRFVRVRLVIARAVALVENVQIRTQPQVRVLALLLEVIGGAEPIDAVVANYRRKPVVFVNLSRN